MTPPRRLKRLRTGDSVLVMRHPHPSTWTAAGLLALLSLSATACAFDRPPPIVSDGGSVDADPNAPDALPVGATVPRPRLPINDSYVGSIYAAGSLRPRFAWDGPSGGAATTTYDLEFGTDPTFATGVTTVSTTETSHQPAAELPVSTSRPVGSRYYWRVRACSSDVCSDPSPARRFNLGCSDQDYNGDGYADIVVGEPGEGPGRAYVYFGTIEPTADGTLTGGADGDAFGQSVASAGDVNGDGYADIVVGAPGTGPGHAKVYFGGAGPAFDATPDGTVNGQVTGEKFGNSVASAGDVNGDGFADIVVGAPSSRGGDGNAYVYLGGPGATFHPAVNADGSLPGLSPDGELGGSVASAGDVNGDGFGDVIVGARLDDAAGPDVGRSFLYFGGAGSSFDGNHDGTLTGAVNDKQFGRSVASAGDVNGDGFADVVVGATSLDSQDTNTGRAYVYLGGAGVFLDTTADTTLLGTSPGENFGSSVASAGDINGDGFHDVVVGAMRTSVNGQRRGGAYIYLGGEGTSLDNISDGALVGAAPGDEFGVSVASAGDINRDGFADVVVGAHNHDPQGVGAGSAYLYLGGAGEAFDATADGTLTGTAYYGRFGTSVN